jgi:predicted nucleotidyltransferase
MQSEVLFKSIFGSHLYGTNVPTSDKDYKQIHKCSVKDILLGKDQMNITNNTNKKEKNTADDIDFESKELRQFIKDCLGGQTYALDLLFTPESLYIQTSKTWDEILTYRNRLVTNNLMPFMGYVKSQAYKYSKKGATLSDIETVLQLFKKKAFKSARLQDTLTQSDLVGLTSVKINNKWNKSTKMNEDYLVVGTSEYPMGRQVADVEKSVQSKYDEYGERAKMAQDMDGVDLKAFYHAYRICWELEELLTEHKITFPSKNVGFLREVRAGKYKKDYLESFLTEEIERVTELPNFLNEPNYEFWDEWLIHEYLGC